MASKRQKLTRLSRHCAELTSRSGRQYSRYESASTATRRPFALGRGLHKSCMHGDAFAVQHAHAEHCRPARGGVGLDFAAFAESAGHRPRQSWAITAHGTAPEGQAR